MLSPITLTETQTRILENLLSVVFGAGASIVVAKITKQKPKKEQDTDYLSAVTKASGESVTAAQQVLEMFKGALEEQTKTFDEKIKLAQDLCNDKIEDLKKEYDIIIETLKGDNESLSIRVNNLTNENLGLSVKLARLQTSYDEQGVRLLDVRTRLSKYENEVITPLKLQSKKDE